MLGCGDASGEGGATGSETSGSEATGSEATSGDETSSESGDGESGGSLEDELFGLLTVTHYPPDAAGFPELVDLAAGLRSAPFEGIEDFVSVVHLQTTFAPPTGAADFSCRASAVSIPSRPRSRRRGARRSKPAR